jgi:hypothetical protein
VTLANGQRLTQHAVQAIAEAQVEAKNDPTRQHVAEALGGIALHVWAEMVDSGWWPPAGVEPEEVDEPSVGYLEAWVKARERVEDVENDADSSPSLSRIYLCQQTRHLSARLRIHRQDVDDVGPALTFWSR